MANPYGYFPASYQAAYNPYQQVFQQAQPAQTQPQTIQSNGLVSVRNRAEAESYPVAPGNSVTFKDETAPFIYVKSMGFSQLDRPTFDIFRLVKEDVRYTANSGDLSAETEKKEDLSGFAKKAEIDALSARIDALEASLKEEPANG